MSLAWVGLVDLVDFDLGIRWVWWVWWVWWDRLEWTGSGRAGLEWRVGYADEYQCILG